MNNKYFQSDEITPSCSNGLLRLTSFHWLCISERSI